jgi:hypothetical protein
MTEEAPRILRHAIDIAPLKNRTPAWLRTGLTSGKANSIGARLRPVSLRFSRPANLVVADAALRFGSGIPRRVAARYGLGYRFWPPRQQFDPRCGRGYTRERGRGGHEPRGGRLVNEIGFPLSEFSSNAALTLSDSADVPRR